MQSTLVAALRVTIRALPAAYRPVRVIRSHGVTVVCMEPTALRWQIGQAVLDHLLPAEMRAVRLAYGQPAKGSMEQWTVNDDPAFLFVPRSLRLIGEPALQGGAELERRTLAGQIGMELACVQADCVVPSWAS